MGVIDSLTIHMQYPTAIRMCPIACPLAFFRAPPNMLDFVLLRKGQRLFFHHSHPLLTAKVITKSPEVKPKNIDGS